MGACGCGWQGFVGGGFGVLFSQSYQFLFKGSSGSTLLASLVKGPLRGLVSVVRGEGLDD